MKLFYLCEAEPKRHQAIESSTTTVGRNRETRIGKGRFLCEGTDHAKALLREVIELHGRSIGRDWIEEEDSAVR